MNYRQAAQIEMPLDPVSQLFGEGARSLGLDLRPDGAGYVLDLPDGSLRLNGRGAGCELVIEAETEARLAELHEIVSHYADEHHQPPIALAWQANQQAGLPANLTLAEIVLNQRISASFRRLRLAGDFSRFGTQGLHFRLIFGPEGADLPSRDATGATVWPFGIDRWHRPPYTVRAIDPDCRWIDVDIFLHDGGRITDWAAQARPGNRVAITGPGGKAPQIADWIAYIGDETALPVIARMLEVLPPETCGLARIFIADTSDRQDIRHPPGVDLDWVLHGPHQTPLAAVKALSPPAESRFVFFAGERQMAVAAREHLLALGLGRGEFHAAAYWTEGWIPPEDQVRKLAFPAGV